MKIVHVIPALTKGGAERVVVDLANSALKSGHEVTIVAAIPAPAKLIANQLHPGVKVRYVGSRTILSGYLDLVPWLIRNRNWLFQQDIVHSHLTFGSVFAFALQRLRSAWRRSQPAIVETYHAVGMAIPKRKRWAHAMLLKRRDATIFMADDPYWRRYSERNPETIFRTIPNGISPPNAPGAERSENYQQQTLLIPRSCEVVVGTVGRLVAERRPDLLLETFTHVAKSLGPDVHFLMAGEGPERHALDAALRSSGIASQVHLPGLVLDPTEPLSLMDLYLTVNVGTTTGIAALEAAFLRVPIVALQLQGDYRCGQDDWIWSSGDPAEVGAKAIELLNDPAALDDLAAKQYAYVRTYFSLELMTRRYDDLYRAALRLSRKRFRSLHAD